MIACTIIARNYAPHARVLARSFTEHHPGLRLQVLVLDRSADEIDEDLDEPYDVLLPSLLDIEPAEFQRMAAIYDVMDLSTAVKPWLLELLLARGDDAVIYLDPDIWVLGSLTEEAELAARHGMVLTPHNIDPLPRDNRTITEGDIKGSGVFNLGFIAVGRRAAPFLAWWKERLSRDCISEPAQTLFVDQRWVDLAPGYFDHLIHRDPGLNVAYWNLDGRHLEVAGKAFTSNGKPLRFVHFSGYDPLQPHILSKHQGYSPRNLLSELPVMAELCRLYGYQLLKEGYLNDRRTPYGLEPDLGDLRLDTTLRRLYRRELIEAERDRKPEPPNPFSHPAEFVDWLNEPQWPTAGVSRFLLAVWEGRGDLRTAFPDLTVPEHAERYLAWARTNGVMENVVTSQLVPAERGHDATAAAASQAHAEGINMAGYLRAELGVGEAGRLLTKLVEEIGVPYTTIAFDRTHSRQEHPFEEHGAGAAEYDINLVCVNADAFRGFLNQMGPGFVAGRYTIGYWNWETEELPLRMQKAFDDVDEVWTPSEFIRVAVAKNSPKPVHCVPYPNVAPAVNPNLKREDVGLPPEFTFLFMFDYLSVFRRKNALGLVEAFQRAFPGAAGPHLAIKTINHERKLLEREQLRLATHGDPRIHLLEGYMASEENGALMALADAYVSLHRSEGFGLTLGEAMALGKPVIATGYSGNLQFMSPTNSFLVKSQPTAVGTGSEPYHPEEVWAEPDLDDAARLLRLVHDDPAAAAATARQGAEDIRNLHSPAAAAEVMAVRIDEIRRRWRPQRSVANRPGVHDASTLQKTAARIDEGPAVAGPTRFGGPYAPIAKLGRKVLRRTFAMQEMHEREVGGLVVQVLREQQQRLDAVESGVSNLALAEKHRARHRAAAAPPAPPQPARTGLPGQAPLKSLINGAEFRVRSQNGEDGALQFIFSKIGTTNRNFVEFGIGDGRECNTANLSLNLGWSGLLMEIDPAQVVLARDYYSQKLRDEADRVRIEQATVLPETIDDLLGKYGVSGRIDLLSIDVDGIDYWIWKAVSAIQPRVVVIEYNPSLGAHRSLAVPYEPDFDRFEKHPTGFYHGASLKALARLGRSKGYILAGCESTGVNAFFVTEEAASGSGLGEIPVEQAFYPEARRTTLLSLDEQWSLVRDLPFTEV